MDEPALLVEERAAESGARFVEVDVVGESHRQDALAMISGPKSEDGKRQLVGLTFRCEPTNEYDSNAIRVESMGQLLGYVPRDTAARLAPALRGGCGGVAEGLGVIVGGWARGAFRDKSGRYAAGDAVDVRREDEGSFGVRAWIDEGTLVRVGIHPADVAMRGRYSPAARPVIPTAVTGERRLTPEPTDLTALPTAVTVTREEHYQEAIEAARPSGWVEPSWPVLVVLDLAPDPHTKDGAERVRVSIDRQPVGFFTKQMTERHGDSVRGAFAAGLTPTAVATVTRDRPEGKAATWQLAVALAMPSDTEVTFTPAWVVNVKTRTRHGLGAEGPDGWHTPCGTVVLHAHAKVLCKSRPFGRVIDQATGEPVELDHYFGCGSCR